MIVVFIAVAFVAHLIVYMAISASWPGAYHFPAALVKIAIAALGLGSVSILLITSRYNNIFTRAAYSILSIWMGLFVYLFIASCLYAIAVGIAHAFGVPGPMSWLGQALGAVAILMTVFGLSYAGPIQTRKISIGLPGLPEFWKGKTAVFVSDIHLGQIHTASFAERVARAVNDHKPDIVLIGGDLYDGVKVDEHAIIAPFASVKPPHGIYFITGNHEEFGDSSAFLEAIRRLGIRVLTNELIDVQGLQIVGVTDHDSIHRGRLSEIISGMGIDRSRASIFMKHQPSHLDIPEKAGLSFQISGHTHRAQLFPLNLIPYWIYKGYSYGLKDFGSMKVYTSSGVGSWGPPMRVGSASEIVVIEFV